MKTRGKWSCVLTLLLSPLLAARALAYGADGHELVGAIADQRLANSATKQKLDQILLGMPLAEAALIPDSIKGWDFGGPNAQKAFHLDPKYVEIEKQLIAFWKANRYTPRNPDDYDHRSFHYCDIEVANATTYKHETVGKEDWDIVHMIPYCVEVLQGTRPETNERKITKPVAVILLAHYLGDIHQPLHVGAEYFDKKGPVDPKTHPDAGEDHGGNNITLVLKEPDDEGHMVSHKYSLHSFWDENTVTGAKRIVREQVIEEQPTHSHIVKDTEIGQWLGTHQPDHWKATTGDPTTWAETWADEILPIARQAHTRLTFSKIKVSGDPPSATAQAAEKKHHGDGYRDWSSGIVRQEIHLGGWRLAELLTKSLDH